MAHYRTQLRAAIKTALDGAVTGVKAGNVSASRYYPIEPTELPFIAISTSSEASALAWTAPKPRGLDRRTDLTVSMYCRAGEGVQDELDAIAEEVEALIVNTDLSAVCRDIWLARTEYVDDVLAEAPTGRLDLVFMVYAVTAENSADTVI